MEVEVVAQSDYLLVQAVRGARDVFIYFAPVQTPPGVYVGSGVLRDCFAHRIYVNCLDNQWYL